MPTTGLTPAERIRADAKAATRRALLDAGLAECMDRGGFVPSIEAICARAGFTRGAFYVHFKGREEFIVELLERVVGDIFQQVFGTATRQEAGLDTIVSRFTATIISRQWPEGVDIRAAYMGVLSALRELAPVRDRHTELMTAAIARLTTAVLDGQRAGTISKALDARHIAQVVLLVGIGLIVWDGVGIPLEPDALGESFLRLLRPTD